MTTNVDVLHLMDEEVRRLERLQDDARNEGNNHFANEIEGDLTRFRITRAAVADLVESATVIDERISYYNTVSNGVSKAIETWNAEEMRRFREALARVKGA